MKKRAIFSLIAAVFVMVLVSGCAKKPKLNLANLREAGNGAGANAQAGNAGDGFVPASSTDPQFAPANGLAGDPNAANGANGGWQSMDQPINGGADPAANFIANGTNWSDKVYFDYNRYEIKADQRPVLEKLANFLGSNPNKAAVIEGHCDERGSDEYNRALSEKRAIVIRDYLKNLGIAEGRMLTVPCGEDKPAIPNASSEGEHRLNRRGQFIVGDKK